MNKGAAGGREFFLRVSPAVQRVGDEGVFLTIVGDALFSSVGSISPENSIAVEGDLAYSRSQVLGRIREMSLQSCAFMPS